VWSSDLKKTTPLFIHLIPDYSMKKILFLTFVLITAPNFLISQSLSQKPFSLQLSVFAGSSPELIAHNRPNVALGIRAGVLHETGLYAGAAWSIHPFVFSSNNDKPIGGAPKVICGELGWEFQLTPTTFLRPYLALGRFGIDNSYQGYGGLTLLPAAESTTWGLGAIYGVQLSRDILVGVEARAIMLAGLHITGNISYRLF
jgi:hypothetical protein